MMQSSGTHLAEQYRYNLRLDTVIRIRRADILLFYFIIISRIRNTQDNCFSTATVFFLTGVSAPVRKMAALQNPTVEVTSDGDGNYTVKQITLIKTHSVKFQLDHEIDETTPDGRKVKVQR